MCSLAESKGYCASSEASFDPIALNEVLSTLIFETEHSKDLERLETVKDCSCGRTFSLEEWLDLPSSGRMHLPQRCVVVEARTCVTRVSTGNSQADEILSGGFPKNSINIVMGQPGTGKSIFAEQLVFRNATEDLPILYLTTRSEPLA